MAEKRDAFQEAGGAVLASPPRGDCYRALTPGPELRDEGRTMFGRFAEFETWTEINSAVEGHFFERVASTAFTKTIRENRGNIRVLFHHGRDALGVQVLGKIDQLDEDTYHEVSLFDGVPALIMDGLRAGVYGSSYRFAIVNHEWTARPRRSDRNPKGLPELTILEAKVREFGPTPLPAYGGTVSGVRSMTDELVIDRLAEDPDRLERMIRQRSGISLNGLDRSGDATSEGEYRRSVELVGSTVWAMHPPALATILAIISERANGVKPTEEDIRRRIGVRADTEPVTSPSVAVIPIQGAIVPRADLLSDMSGATSIESLQAAFRAALQDPDVSAILLDVDSPGGDARMVPELAAEIQSARGTKPIVAVANPTAASGAYWLASAADEIVVTPSGDVGSIGVYTAHTDLSAAQEKAGIKTTLVSAGEYKVERNPFEPLTDEAEAAMQERVDSIYDTFVNAVAAGRNVDADTVKDNFGKGRMVLAPLAVKAGMADRVGTLSQTLARLEKAAGETTRSEPEPHGVTTRAPGAEPEPSEATTHTSSHGLFRFVDPPKHLRSE